MKSFITTFAALAVATSFSLAADEKKPAAGEKPKADPAAVFKKKDTNGDGSLSLDEYKAGAKDAAKAEESFKKKDKKPAAGDKA